MNDCVPTPTSNMLFSDGVSGQSSGGGPHEPALLWAHFESTEVMAALARMRSGSSSVGILTPSALKVASIEVIACITTLLSKCAHVGAMPECWARCAVTPVHKSGSLQSADNFRGIAVGTLLAKVYAAVIERRLTEYLEANNLRAQG